MIQVKGTAIASTLRFVRERFGAEAVAEVRGDVEPAFPASLPGEPLASAWYPFALLVALGRSAARRYGGGMTYFHREMGRASADYAMNTVYRIFFKLGSPHFVVSRATRVWRTYYDTGEFTPRVSEPGHAVLDLSGFTEPVPELCERLIGWMSRSVELAGGKNLRSAHTLCLLRGDEVCRFEGWWE
ncbi:MAG TPA: hypothetical protein VF310_15650 [Vicinamibacteria bacterium]